VSGARHWEGQAGELGGVGARSGARLVLEGIGAAVLYLVADAARLPFEDASFDLVVAFNTLMDFDDMPGAVREAARVLEPAGRLCACITHPMRDAGRFESRDPDAPFIIRGSYFGKRRFALRVARGGYEVDFRGWAYPLSDYTRTLEESGFLIESMREPPDPDRPLPNFLLIRAVTAPS
jgi:SAM-dependent methyltransferase